MGYKSFVMEIKMRNGISTRALLAGFLMLAPLLPLAAPQAFAQAQLLPNVADLADKVLPSVVEISIESKAGGATPGLPEVPQLPDDSPFKDFFDDFLKKRQGEGGGQTPSDRTVTSMGSGFVIDAQGFLVTNNHVVEGAEKITVKFQDGTELKAELVGRDAKTDLAVIKVKSDKPLPVVSFGDSDKLRIGEWVMAIGNPYGLGGSVSLGIVSARNREINSGPYDDFIQTDAAINRGNSGGPLFSLNGDVMGVNTAIFSPTGGSVGIGFSVPANTAKNVINQLIKFGETKRGWLGAMLQPITPDIDESMGLKGQKGALVADVTKDSPGSKGGLLAGDVIYEFDGRVIKEMKELPKAVAETEVGKKVVVKVKRKGADVALSIELGRLEDGEKKIAAQKDEKAKVAATATLLGMTVSTITDDLRKKFKADEKIKGVIITEVSADGAASEKRLEPGDVIVEAGGNVVESAADVSEAVAQAEKDSKSSVLLLVAKGGKDGETRFIALKIKK